MKTRPIGFAVAALVVVGLLQAAALQDAKPPSASGQEPGMPMPQPTPFHKYLSEQAGSWDALVKSTVPGSPPAEDKGTETIAMMSGLWQLTDFKGTFGGTPFLGHGVMGYDPAKKKYVGTWVDSMTDKLIIMEGTADTAGKVLTMTYEQADPASGQMTKYRNVHEMKDSDTRTFTMSQVGADGKDVTLMTITYKRRKT
jgi:hypothetical protein